MLSAWEADKLGEYARFVDGFVGCGGGWNSRFWLLKIEYVLILHGFTCDTLPHAVEIPIRDGDFMARLFDGMHQQRGDF